MAAAPASITWTIPSAAAHTIFVAVDPLDTIDELDETDNIASQNLTSATLPDLSISSADITISPSSPEPYTTTTIFGKLRNLGESDATNVVVDYLMETSGPNPVRLVERSVSYTVHAGGVVDLVWVIEPELASGGPKTIRIAVDPQSAIIESDKTNNTAIKTFIIGADVDVYVNSSDISFSPANPRDGDMVTLTSVIGNRALGAARNVVVRHLLGNPATGGTRIGNDIVVPLIEANGRETVTLQWNSTGHAGNNHIFVVVDPDDIIVDYNKWNNTAYKNIKVASTLGPDLTVSQTDIVITPMNALSGDDITISAAIRNVGTRDATNVLVSISISDAITGERIFVSSPAIGFLIKGGVATVQAGWNTSSISGVYEVFIEVDAENAIAELNEANNAASSTITVTAVQGPDIVVGAIDRSGVISNTQTRTFSGNVVATIKNIGNRNTELPFIMTAFEDRNSNQVYDVGTDMLLVQATYTGNLTPGSEATVTLAVSGSVDFIDRPLYLHVDSGNAVPETDETNNSSCLAIFTTCRNSKVDAAIKSGASWLIDHQVNVDTQGTMKAWAGFNVYYNALAVNAYKSNARTTGTKYANILDKLISMQATDGSWDESLYTAEALRAMLKNGADPASTAITDAVAWLIRTQSADGSWGGTAVSTGRVLAALVKANVNKNEPYIQKAVQWLTDNRNSDGYWGDYPGISSNPAVDTDCVIGLALATSPSDSRVQKAKTWYYPYRNNYVYTRLFWVKMMLEIEPQNSELSSITSGLLNLTMADGGWAWIPAYTSSDFYMSTGVLDVAGRLGLTGTKINNGIVWTENHINSFGIGFPEGKSSSITDWALDALQAADIGNVSNLNAISAGRKTIIYSQYTDGVFSLAIPKSVTSYLSASGNAIFMLKNYRDISAAEQSAINKGINFLLPLQLADGGWPQWKSANASSLSDSIIVLKGLLASGVASNNTIIVKGLSYLNAKQNADGGFGNTEQTARAAIIYKLAGVSYQTKLNQTIEWLKTNQNPDGGWGTTLGFTSTTGSTSWALIALSYAGESGIAVAKGVSWLLAAQNGDNGWGALMGIPVSYDSTTAYAVWALSLSKFNLAFNLDLSTERQSYCPGDTVRISAIPDVPAGEISVTGALKLQEGTSAQLAFSLADNTFSSEYVLPSTALPGTATIQTTGQATYGYGVATTNFIVRNCATLQPDLSGTEPSETLPDPLNRDIRSIIATVRNIGSVDANNVTVNFYSRSPLPENLIATMVIPNIPAYTGAQTVSTTLTISEDTTVYVIVDPSNVITEADETNNASLITLIRQISDLSINSSDISILPSAVTEGQAAVLSAIIHNTGNLGAADVAVSFYDGDPEFGGMLIGTVTKSWIDAGSTAYAEFMWNTFGQSGMNYIHVMVDPLNVILEGNETNNSSFIPVDVTPPAKPDLAITGTDIAFSNLNPEEGAPLTLTATIRNLGSETANISVALYDSDPAAGGKLIAMKTVYQFIPFGNAATLPFDIPTSGMAGNHKYYIVLDPEHVLDEINEANNVAWNTATIGASGLGLSITTDKAAYTANEDISITLNISNQRDTNRTGTLEVKLLDSAGTVVSSATVSQVVTLGPSETQTLSFTLNTGSILAEDYRVFSQFIEAGNAVSKIDTAITIAADRAVSLTVTTDKASYYPNQPVTLTSSIASLSQNYIFENLTAKMTIADWAYGPTPLHSETETIPILLPGQMTELKTSWNISTYPPGAYAVTLEVRDAADTLVSLGTATLLISDEIRPSKFLRGQISVDQQSIMQGEPVNISYQVSNVGNMDISQVNLSLKTVHVVNLSVYDTLTDQTALLMGNSYSNIQQLGTGRYSAKDYLVILAAESNGVEDTVASSYFRVEGAPSGPSLNTPAQSSDVETLSPILSVNNATDPNDDRLTYEFEIYSDSGLSNLVASSGIIPEGTGTTAWHPLAEAHLQENSWYFWRARAYDGQLYGQWIDPAAFRLNVTNEPPTEPTLSAPAENSDVNTQLPLLRVNNATDPDSFNLTYNFIVALDPDFLNIVDQQLGVFAGQGSASWQVTAPLQENTWYYWKAQADDWLITGPWMTTARFFVNTTNEAPSTPMILDPEDNSELASAEVRLTTSNSADPDSETITCFFEVDSSLTFDSPDRVTSGSVPQGTGTTSWLASGLKDNTYYYARVKATDGNAESQLSTVVGFFVNTQNDSPTVPVAANPSNGSGINTFNPLLSVHNSTDPDRDMLTYEFEVYADAAMTELISSATDLQESQQNTGWTAPVTLMENSTYFWRARAFDGELYSPWMALSSFTVNTANDAPTAPLLKAPAQGNSLSTLTPTLSINNATDPDSDSLTYDFEVYSGATLVRSMTAIPQNPSGTTSVTLSPALSDNTTYTWRARAYDGDRFGTWMDMETFSIHQPVTNITATIDFDPNTLNQKSKGNWVTVYIELPAWHNAVNINMSSLRLNGSIPAISWPYALGDYDYDGIPDLMVKFDRNVVINLLPKGDKVKVTVTGTVGGVTFEGVDFTRVIH